MDTTELYANENIMATKGAISTSQPDYSLNMDVPERKSYIIVPALVMVVGAIGNVLIVYVIGWKYNHTTHKILLLSLAYYDIMGCFIVLPLLITHILLWHKFKSDAACKIMTFVGYYSAFGSSTTLLVVAIERYKKIVKPLSKQISVKVASLICLVIGGPISGVLSSPSVILYTVRPTQNNFTGDSYNLTSTYYRCKVDEAYDNTAFNTLSFVALILYIAVCTITMAFLYFSISKTIRESVKLLQKMRNNCKPPSLSVIPNVQLQLSSGQGTFPSTSTDGLGNRSYIPIQKRKRQERQIAKLSFALTLLFILSYVPFLSFHMLHIVYPGYKSKLSKISNNIFEFFYPSFILNYVGNLFIYLCFDIQFRKNIKCVVRCRE